MNMIMKESRRTRLFGGVVLAFALMLAMAGSANADPILNYTYGNAAPTIDNTYGTVELAWNLGGGPTLTQDGISFAGKSPSGGSWSDTESGVTVQLVAGGASLANYDSGDDLFQMFTYNNGNKDLSTIAINISGLDSGKSYQVQYLYGDSRTSNGYDQTVTATDSSSNTGIATVHFGNDTDDDHYGLLTAVVSGSTSLNLAMPGKDNHGPSIGGVVISSIPEPASGLMLIAGAVGLGLLRRKLRG